MINLELGVSPQAWAVLHALVPLLADHEGGNPMTYAWYDGRETGFSLEFTFSSESLFIVVAEHCRSDDILVYHWRGPTCVLPPPGLPSLAVNSIAVTPKHFHELRVDLVTDYVLLILEEALTPAS